MSKSFNCCIGLRVRVPIKSEANNLGIRMLLWMSGYRRQNMIRKKPVERKVEGLCISYYKKGDRISSCKLPFTRMK
jgi:hypothetical protein